MSKCLRCAQSLALALAGCVVVAGCDSFPDLDDLKASQPPVANAGADQAAAGGDAVTLDGSASSDPDAKPLSFQWVQLAGTPVALADATTANPSFTAPDSDETLSFQLTVDNGEATATDEVNVTVTAAAGPGPDPEPEEPKAEQRLFVVNDPFATEDHVISYFAPDEMVGGNFAPDTNLQGANTKLNLPWRAALNSFGELSVINAVGPNWVMTFDTADLNGNKSPIGVITGPALHNPISVAWNNADDLLFVGDWDGAIRDIMVFDDVNGNLAPVRTIKSTDISWPNALHFGSGDQLYVANSLSFNILVFDNASSLNGTVAASRKIGYSGFPWIQDVFVDSHDNMYVVGFDKVFMYQNASTLNGAEVEPDTVLTVPGAPTLISIDVDDQGTAYIASYTTDSVYSYDDIMSKNGTIAPDRTFTGANTAIDNPREVVLAK